MSDETGVDKVSFFTWTAKNGQDDISKKDIKVDSGEGEEKEITYHVNQSDIIMKMAIILRTFMLTISKEIVRQIMQVY